MNFNFELDILNGSKDITKCRRFCGTTQIRTQTPVWQQQKLPIGHLSKLRLRKSHINPYYVAENTAFNPVYFCGQRRKTLSAFFFFSRGAPSIIVYMMAAVASIHPELVLK